MIEVIQIILLVFIAWVVVSRNHDLLIRLFGKRRKLILDSCALIDGRIVEIVNKGFIADELVLPQFVITELQLLADGNDSHKRERARFGLDIAHQLQDSAPGQVVIDRTILPGITTTDDKLVGLAKKFNALLYTTDYNLAKVAAVEGVTVLNVNELAQALRPVTLPGEALMIKIIQKGSNRDQGVGYLEDGTMIVVDNAARYVGQTMPVTVTRMHQTVAGKMVFGQIKESNLRQMEADTRPSRPHHVGSHEAAISSTEAPVTAATASTATAGAGGRSGALHRNATRTRLQGRLNRVLRKPVRRRPRVE